MVSPRKLSRTSGKHIRVAVFSAFLFHSAATALSEEPRRIEINATVIGMQFDPREFTVEPGRDVELVFRAPEGGMVHNLLIVEPGAVDEVAEMALDLGNRGMELAWVPESEKVLHHTGIVEPGEEEVLRFVAPETEGVYPYVCTIPGHAATMRGRMRVTSDPESQGEPAAGNGRSEWGTRYQEMDTGPFYSGVIELPERGDLDKGLTIRIGNHRQASVHFDTDLLRMSAGWTNGFLRFHSEEDAGIRNIPPPSPEGEIRFTASGVGGWSMPREDSGAPRFRDPRPRPFGPMPEPFGRYGGVYLHGDRVVLAYTAHGTRVYESPWFLEDEEIGIFVRDIELEAQASPLVALLFDHAGPLTTETHGALRIVRGDTNQSVTAAAILENDGSTLVTGGEFASISLKPEQQSRTVRVLIWQGHADRYDAFLALAQANAEPEDLSPLREPGPARWGDPLSNAGEPGHSQGPYTVDRIRPPLENPFNALFHFTGVDFTANGRAVLTTMHGDVWIVDGLDDTLNNLSWKRFATGLNQPFGVRVVDGLIYVASEDELTILIDRNGNGEADYYENFKNLIAPGAGAWRQAFGLEVDASGNFFFARGRGRWGSDFQNGIIRVSADGTEMETIATGFRQPWAIGLSPEGRVTVSQQEGPWVPQTPVHMIDQETRRGGFYGFVPGRRPEDEDYPREIGFEPPIVWMPRHVDNTGGGQVWVPSDQWGLPQDSMLHISGTGQVMHLFHEQIDGDRQGGVAPLVRLRMWRPRMGRFHPGDGQLYVVGPFPAGALERVRHTGAAVHLPVGIHAHENGVRLRFNHPVGSAAANPANYSIQRWNYLWSETYGSDRYSVDHPGRLGQDAVEIANARLSDNERDVFLEIPAMKPAMQLRLQYDIEAADGTPMQEAVYSTIHALGPPWDSDPKPNGP